MRVRRNRLAMALAAAMLLAGAAAANADDGAVEAIRVFLPAQFADASPGDAADMVRRLPGFAIVEADEDVRGYAAAQGNVLIDGARPASKREDIADVLGRIPADAVERIELIRGGAGVDMAGHAMLANVVRRRDPAPELSIEAGVSLAGDGWSAPLAAIEYGRRRGGRALDLAYSHDPEPEEDSGEGRIDTYDADGFRSASERTDDRSIATADAASLHWRQPWLGGDLDVDASVRRDEVAFDGRTTGASADDEEHTREDEDLRQAELGLRWAHTLAGGTTVSALASRQRGWLEAREISRDNEGGEVFAEDTDTGESLASLVFGRDVGDALALTAGVELARNELDSRARLFVDGEPVALPGSQVRVVEDRGEAGFSGEWQATEAWRLEAGLRIEDSRLRQSGDQQVQRHFTYFKPRLAATWEHGGDDVLRWSLEREVGQLDFGDFVASASLATGEVSAGNAALEPDKAWRNELAWEHRFGDDGSLVVAWIHEEIDDVVDRVPVTGEEGEVFDAPGNIGSGRRDGLSVELGLPLQRLGLTGARLTAGVLWQRSRVRDPGTGERRGISGDKPVEGSIGFEQVLADGAFTWGIDVDLAESEREYRFDEISTETEGASWSLFAERRLRDGWRLRGELSDADGQHIGRVRDRYDGLRGDDTFEEREIRRHRTPGLVALTLRRDF